jgi:hypothetical protein
MACTLPAFAAPTDVDERSKGLREPAILTFQAVAIPAGDAGLTKLYKQRYNAVGAELRDLCLLYRGGKVRFPEVASAVERYAKAAMALGTTTEQRIKQLRLAQDVAIWLERMARDKFENEVEPENVMRRAEALRFHIDILIQKEYDAAEAGTATKQ